VSGPGASTGDRLTAFFTAIAAVLAAIGTLYAHGRSIQALAIRNQAVLSTLKATDRYNYWQSKQLKVTLYEALHERKESLEEQRAALAVYDSARALEVQAAEERDQSSVLLHSFETLEIATTLFEISIAFASIAALTGTRILLWSGMVLTALGVILGLLGYFQAH